VKRHLEEYVVDILGFSRIGHQPTRDCAAFTPAQWERCLTWMDDMGLALYFFRAVEPRAELVPEFVTQRLQRRQSANEYRMRCMQRQFGIINRQFETAGVKYIAVKGLTLVPEFCPDASLRHQSDFDFLMDQSSLQSARQLLEEMGYVLYKTFDHELIFVLPSNEKPKRGEAQYDASAPHSVELHLTMGDFPCLAWKEPSFLENAVVRVSGGSTFHGLTDDDSFLLQAVHIFHHVLDGWMKLSWLYEIGHFLETRTTDSDLWKRISGKLAVDPLLREAVAVVASLASKFFQARIPVVIEGWIRGIRPAVLVWIENYARIWAFGPNRIDEFDWFPTNKLVLFLHRQYIPDNRDWRALLTTRLLALKGLKRMKHSMSAKQSSGGRKRIWISARALRRVAFHLGSGIRYFWEMPKWWHLTRSFQPGGNAFEHDECSPVA